ncbi:MAG TPA: hypothetical protein VIM36_12125 [Gemmatimonadaceae bacterium]
MTDHPPLIAGQQPFTGDANARKQEIERTRAALANPGGRAPVV